MIQNPFTDDTAFNIITQGYHSFALKSTFVLIFLTMLVPASMFLVPVQAQEDATLEVSSNLGTQGVPLKAIKDSDDNIDVQNDFEIEPQNVITVLHAQPFHVVQSEGSLIAVKATDQQRITTDLTFSSADGRVTQNLAAGSYLLDIIVEMDNDDRFLYETVLTVLTPGQTLSQVTIQNIIQNFVSSSSSSSHTTVVFRDDNDDEPDEDEPSICYFEPNNDECDPLPDGSCPEGFGHNDDNQCIPQGDCPDGFGRIDDDETGTCYSDDDIVDCDNGAKVLDEDDCAIYDPNPPADPAQVCFFEPNDPVCNPNEDGSCNEGFHHNDDEQCVPDGACPEGYGRLDDDETGKCFAEHAIKTCPNGAKVLQSQVCPASEAFPNEPVAGADNDTSSEEPEAEPITCEEGFVLENGACAALDSNCGGVPCTASDKENSTTSDPVPGKSEPETTDSEETEQDSEGGEEQNNDDQSEEQQPEQEESSAEDSEQEN